MSRTILAPLAASLMLFASSAAFAHAKITATSIADGGAVASAPASFSVTFNEPVRMGSVTLTNSAGQVVPITHRAGTSPAATFSVPLPRLPVGTYTMTFRSIGADGHAMAPKTSFTIGAAAASAPARGAGQSAGMGGMAGMKHDGASMRVTTSIADGAVLTTAPTSMRINFPHAMRLTSVRLSVATGETIPVRLPTGTAPTTTADITFPRLEADSYTLTWGADAGDHTMGGTVRFRVR
jgi:methionine-rich copper-binding protein CopC